MFSKRMCEAVISIHATHTGGDGSHGPAKIIRGISIHATHTGGDNKANNIAVLRKNFNPRHPYGWRPDAGPGGATTTGNFNPRHPYGWRLSPLPGVMIRMIFQSTPPIRVATTGGPRLRRIWNISIHATHTGGDECCAAVGCQRAISIHATHTGGDGCNGDIDDDNQISIHATHTGGDDTI